VLAAGTTSITAGVVAIVASFSYGNVHNGVSASFITLTVCTAAITTNAIPVVTQLAHIELAISAILRLALGAAPITPVDVPIIAAFTSRQIGDQVSTHFETLTIGAATVAVDVIAIVTKLRFFQLTIPALLNGTCLETTAKNDLSGQSIKGGRDKHQGQ
jgi:hypothetical protein